MAGIVEASAQHPKPEGAIFSYGTAGVSVTVWIRDQDSILIRRVYIVSNESVRYHYIRLDNGIRMD